MRALAVLLLFSTAAAFAQSASQKLKISYEGQTVGSIYLIAGPHRNTEPLLPLMLQQPGEPYSQEKIQASAAALQKAGDFRKVEVNVDPEAGGLRVSFVLEPAYYPGVIRFPEAAKHFSYTRLLQVVNLRDEDPYVKARALQSAKSLQRFLRHNGFFQSQVSLEEQIDDAHEIVSVIFHTQLGKRAKIGKVDIRGPTAPEAADLLHSVRSLRARFTGGLLKPGKTYSRERIETATALIKSALAKDHRLAGHVRENRPQYHPETNRADVSFTVETGPEVNVRSTGARLSVVPFLSGRQARKLIPIYSEGAVDPELVSEGRANLEDYFQKKGYFDVKVTTHFARAGDKISILYQINKGKKHKVERIVFRGNRRFSGDDLLARAAIRKGRFLSHGSFSQKLLKKSVRTLEAVYHDAGYEEVKVTPQVADHEPSIDVTFQIAEGQQTLVEGLHVNGNQAIPYESLTAPKGFAVRPGGPFSPRRISEDRNRILATYLDRGYLSAEMDPVITRRPEDRNRVDVTYNITEHQPVRVDQVVYLGQKQARVSLVRQTAELPPESPMSQTKALEAESRLYELGVFDWASVGPRKPVTTQTDEEMLIKVHEDKRNEITYGFGFEISRRGGNVPTGTVAVPGGPPVGLGDQQVAPSEATFASPRGSIAYTRRNIRGLGETGSISLLLSRLDQRALATYTVPYFRGTRWTALTSLSAERTTANPLFAASLGQASFQLERILNRKTNTRLQLRYAFKKTTLSQLLVPGLVLPQDTRVHLSTFSATLLRDTRDKPLDAHRGSLSTIDLGITPSVLGSSADFVRLFSQYAFYKPIHSLVWANSLRLGWVKSFAGSFVPTSELFFSGGGATLRGFPINEAGPQRLVPFCDVLTGQTGCVNVTVPVGGRQLFVLNSELRFPLGIMKNFGGVVFYDAGNVYRAINFRSFVDNYSNTVGFGFRYSTPVGPIRIDIGRNLNPVPGIKATQFFITLGQAF